MLRSLTLLLNALLLAALPLLSGGRTVSAASPACPARTGKAVKVPEFAPGKTDTNVVTDSILAYLNQGGAYSGLRKFTLDERGQVLGSVLPVDLNKDGVEEIFLSSSFYNPNMGSYGWIAIFECKNGAYSAIQTVLADSIYSLTVVRIADIMELGYPQVILDAVRVGSACAHWVILTGWNGMQYSLSLDQAGGLDMYCPATIKVFDYDQDGRKDIYMRGTTAGILEDGIGRGVIKVFGWQQTEFTEIETIYLPSPYRIHILQDAQLALDKGRIMQAIANYEKAATRTYYLEEPTYYERENHQVAWARPYQMAFANFRLVVLWLSLDRPYIAARVIDRMTAQYAPKTPSYEFVELAMAFEKYLRESNDVRSACQVIAKQIDEQYPDLGYGHLGFFGEANVGYASGTICPFY